MPDQKQRKIDWQKEAVIRPSTEEEAKNLKELIVTAYTPIEAILGRKPRGMLETEEKILERIRKRSIFSVYYKNRLVGTFTIQFNDEFGLIEISKVAIIAELQNKGLGTYLMDTAEQMLRERGERKVMIETYDDHKRLVNFYKHRGYQTFHSKVNKGNLVLMMEKELYSR
ncbi:MAG: GNAT family N-acetyltransferase [Candidatus Heimdallarchaeota archaeon]|nr:GNAT family N-acetyltransferase [Candidatus Heimdallarchaeota archaeon]